MKPKESNEKPTRFGWLKGKCAMLVGAISGLFTFFCGRNDKITATEYAKAHGMDVRAVIAAAAESRMEPQAYTQGPDLPVSREAQGDSVIVSRRATIRPRFNERR